MPFDCTWNSTGGFYTLDADPTITCLRDWRHAALAPVSFVVMIVYTIVSFRVLRAGGSLSNVEFSLTRFWRTTEDRFHPRHIHPLSPARVEYRVGAMICKLVLVLVALFFTTRPIVQGIVPVVAGFFLLLTSVLWPPFMPSSGE